MYKGRKNRPDPEVSGVCFRRLDTGQVPLWHVGRSFSIRLGESECL